MTGNKKLTLAPTIISSEAQKYAAQTGFKGRMVTSKELLGESNVLIIEHEGEIYHLRATKFGKLVLTK
ncbi:MAG: Hemin uptake protein hemP [Pseudomonadota bacterium]|jgi:hemin uptake protein HemP